ncbi:MAG: MFS transporter [Clostridia bacterium]|nr:MFS transporter [Clostridia bacterium]
MEIANEKSLPKFGIKDKLGYLFGDFGNDFTFILSSSFLLKFYTDVMGVAPWIVGLIMTIARFVDAFTDVTMGRICDRSRMTRVGKFKPWIRRMCAPVAIASFLIYQSSLADAAMWIRVTWLSVTYILWGSIFYTSINIPYGSMASSISREPSDRQSLSTFRSIGSTLAGVIVGAGVPLLAYDTAEGAAILNGPRFTLIAGIFSILAVVCYLLCYYLTTERVRTVTPHEEQPGVATLLKRAAKHRALISIIAASVVMLLAQLTMQSMANYVYPNYYGNVTAQSVSTFAMMGGMFLAAGVAKPLSERFGKAEISTVASVLAAAVCILLFIFRPSSVWVYVALNCISWLGLGVFSMVSWALITDVIDDAEIRNGRREDGSIYALYSFARKLGQALAAGLSGGLLSLIGYSDQTAFDPGVLAGIYTISTLLPAVGFALLAVVLRFWYPLQKKKVEENVRILKAKHSSS